MKDDLIVVCGAGGFIGGHLVADLLKQGHTRIRAVDIKPLDRWYQRFDGVENFGSADLQRVVVMPPCCERCLLDLQSCGRYGWDGIYREQ